MPCSEAEQFFSKGLKDLTEGKTIAALVQFERAIQVEESPTYRSYLAYCIAKERGLVKKAISICEDAIKNDPGTSVHYLNLGKIYILAGRIEDAQRVFRQGLQQEFNQQIVFELDKLEVRKKPFFSMFHRDHPLNKYFGLFLNRVGLR